MTSAELYAFSPGFRDTFHPSLRSQAIESTHGGMSIRAFVRTPFVKKWKSQGVWHW